MTKFTVQFDNDKPMELEGYVGTIQMGLTQLLNIRKVQGPTKELNWDIKLYEWILAQPDKEKKAEEYFRGRMPEGHMGAPFKKRDVVKKLGWKI